MPCCAFALFVMGQLAAGLMAIRRALGFSGADTGPAPLNPATAWQLLPAQAGAGAPRPSGRGRRLGGWLLLVGALEVALVVGGFAWLHGGDHADHAAGAQLHAAASSHAAGPHGVVPAHQGVSLHD